VKAPAFDYVRVRSLDQAISLLGEHGESGRIIAGGQSLVPALNLRLLGPSVLIDIGALAELRGVSVANGAVRIGALTRHVDIARSPDIARHAPLLAKAVAHVAHPAVRNRGTIGGNFAHADPASELPACAIALAGRVVVRGPGGERAMAAEDFFKGAFDTALSPGEMVTAIEVPAARPKQRSSFLELARRSGDFALAGLAAHASVADGALRDVRLAYFGIGAKPTLARTAAAHLAGRPVNEAAMAEAAAALDRDLAAQDDLHASAATRMHLARVLLRRALGELLPGMATSEPRRRRA
jgi:carbon-monoxide dehydrogenase medium subunit